MRSFQSFLLFGFALIASSLFTAAPSFAVVDILDRQGMKINPAQFQFTDENGTSVTLDRYFNQGRPVILSFVYFECPGACTLLLNGMIAGLRQLVKVPGKGFDIVVVSIDPKETPSLAQQKKANSVAQYAEEGTGLERVGAERRKNSDSGWHFLVGTQEEILALTSTLGFQFEKDANGVYIHPSALFFFTRDGILSSTLMGVTFPKKELGLAISHAASGELGIVQRIAYICYAYLPHVGWLNSPERWMVAIGFSLTALLSLTAIFLLRRRKPLQSTGSE